VLQISNVLTDRGSRYAVSGDAVLTKKDAESVVNKVKLKKKFAKATHNSWAVLFKDGSKAKNDDGEGGAGALILQILEREALYDHVLVVTRWYGGVHLGGDRFKHIKTCAKRYILALK